ncbi:gp619 [Bacillus phage G]|uniref:Gp619 n=1 Tax=Bacillus phage G TaxID=2884420 RepID=G3MAZ9_9CAUD|nr:gp619 [Bacillus phage G]AEO93864.1 gp619 [Bacillus phage G]
MSVVKWWVENDLSAVEQGKMKRRAETTLSDILLNWGKDATAAKETHVKFIKVTNGRSKAIEFEIHTSEPITKKENRMYQNIPIIIGKYQLVFRRANLKRKDGPQGNSINIQIAREKLDDILDSHPISAFKAANRNWVDLDELNVMLMEIDEFMQEIESYEVMDTLMF